MTDGPDDRYTAFGFWKVEERMLVERVRKKPQSYGYQVSRRSMAEVQDKTYNIEHLVTVTCDGIGKFHASCSITEMLKFGC